MRVKARVEKLEAQNPTRKLDDVPLDVLNRFGYLAAKWFATGSLDAPEQLDLLEISNSYDLLGSTVTLADWEHFFEAEWSDPELARQEQARINEFARSDPAYRPFATQQTWCNTFDSPRLAARWWVAVEKSNLSKAKRERATDLLRRRARNIQLKPTEIEWLTMTLRGIDLGPEGPWLRDHLEGGSVAER